MIFTQRKISVFFWIASLLFFGVSTAHAESFSNFRLKILSSSTPNPISGSNSTQSVFSNYTYISGIAYPYAKVVFLKDGVLWNTYQLGETGEFVINVPNGTLPEGASLLHMYAQDWLGNKSGTVSVLLPSQIGYDTFIEQVSFSPAFKVEVRVLDFSTKEVLAFGTGYPGTTVIITVFDSENLPIKNVSVVPNHEGKFSVSLGSDFDFGSYVAYAKNESAILNVENGIAQHFIVGEETGSVEEICDRADVNCDGKVDLVDFSIIAYWFGKSGASMTPELLQIERERLNGDGIIDLRDFSIIAYYWTG